MHLVVYWNFLSKDRPENVELQELLSFCINLKVWKKWKYLFEIKTKNLLVKELQGLWSKSCLFLIVFQGFRLVNLFAKEFFEELIILFIFKYF